MQRFVLSFSRCNQAAFGLCVDRLLTPVADANNLFYISLPKPTHAS